MSRVATLAFVAVTALVRLRFVLVAHGRQLARYRLKAQSVPKRTLRPIGPGQEVPIFYGWVTLTKPERGVHRLPSVERVVSIEQEQVMDVIAGKPGQRSRSKSSPEADAVEAADAICNEHYERLLTSR